MIWCQKIWNNTYLYLKSEQFFNSVNCETGTTYFCEFILVTNHWILWSVHAILEQPTSMYWEHIWVQCSSNPGAARHCRERVWVQIWGRIWFFHGKISTRVLNVFLNDAFSSNHIWDQTLHHFHTIFTELFPSIQAIFAKGQDSLSMLSRNLCWRPR